jgi:uncharacterized RDD family membrane protein YckC
VAADSVPHQARIAAPWQRLSAWLLDVLLWGAVMIPIELATGVSPRQGHSPRGFVAFASGAFILLVAVLVYCDGSPSGATPGKRMLGLRVVGKGNESPIRYPRAILRRTAFLLGGWCLYLGWLWMLIDRDRQAWHDKAANSIVISTRD